MKIYDRAARDRIRNALYRYKEHQGLSAQELADAISAAHPRKVEVMARRVARFLADQHPPQDDFIGWCDHFVQAVAIPRDPFETLAESLCAIYGRASTTRDLEGEFVDRGWVFTFERRPHHYSVRANQSQAGRWAEGVMVAASDGYFVVLHDQLSKAPMSGFLDKDLRGTLSDARDTVELKLGVSEPALDELLDRGGRLVKVQQQRFQTRDFDGLHGVDPVSGSTALISAILRGSGDLVAEVIRRGGWGGPDARGRWPTTIAAICRSSEAVVDMVVEAEERARTG